MEETEKEYSTEPETDNKTRGDNQNIFTDILNCFSRLGKIIRRLLRWGNTSENYLDSYGEVDPEVLSTMSGATTVSGFTITALDDSCVDFNIDLRDWDVRFSIGSPDETLDTDTANVKTSSSKTESVNAAAATSSRDEIQNGEKSGTKSGENSATYKPNHVADHENPKESATKTDTSKAIGKQEGQKIFPQTDGKTTPLSETPENLGKNMEEFKDGRPIDFAMDQQGKQKNENLFLLPKKIVTTQLSFLGGKMKSNIHPKFRLGPTRQQYRKQDSKHSKEHSRSRFRFRRFRDSEKKKEPLSLGPSQVPDSTSSEGTGGISVGGELQTERDEQKGTTVSITEDPPESSETDIGFGSDQKKTETSSDDKHSPAPELESKSEQGDEKTETQEVSIKPNISKAEQVAKRPTKPKTITKQPPVCETETVAKLQNEAKSELVTKQTTEEKAPTVSKQSTASKADPKNHQKHEPVLEAGDGDKNKTRECQHHSKTKDPSDIKTTPKAESDFAAGDGERNKHRSTKASLLKTCFSVEHDSDDDEQEFRKAEPKPEPVEALKSKELVRKESQWKVREPKGYFAAPKKRVDYSIFTTDYRSSLERQADRCKLDPKSQTNGDGLDVPAKEVVTADIPRKGGDNSCKRGVNLHVATKKRSPDVPMKKKIEMLVDKDSRHLLNLKESMKFAKMDTMPSEPAHEPKNPDDTDTDSSETKRLQLEIRSEVREFEIIISLGEVSEIVIQRWLYIRLVNHFLLNHRNRLVGDSLERQLAGILREHYYLNNDTDRMSFAKAFRKSLLQLTKDALGSNDPPIRLMEYNPADIPARLVIAEDLPKPWGKTERRNNARLERLRSELKSKMEKYEDDAKREKTSTEPPKKFIDKSTDTSVPEPTLYCKTLPSVFSRPSPWKDLSRKVRKNEKCTQTDSSVEFLEPQTDGSEYSIAVQQENFDIGIYRMDDHVTVEKAKKGCRPEEKTKVKTRGIPNKHLDSSLNSSFMDDSNDSVQGEPTEEKTHFGETEEDLDEYEKSKKANFDQGPVILDARHKEALPYKVLHEKKRNQETTPPSSGKKRKKRNQRRTNKGAKDMESKAKLNLQTMFNFNDEQTGYVQSRS